MWSRIKDSLPIPRKNKGKGSAEGSSVVPDQQTDLHFEKKEVLKLIRGFNVSYDAQSKTDSHGVLREEEITQSGKKIGKCIISVYPPHNSSDTRAAGIIIALDAKNGRYDSKDPDKNKITLLPEQRRTEFPLAYVYAKMQHVPQYGEKYRAEFGSLVVDVSVPNYTPDIARDNPKEPVFENAEFKIEIYEKVQIDVARPKVEPVAPTNDAKTPDNQPISNTSKPQRSPDTGTKRLTLADMRATAPLRKVAPAVSTESGSSDSTDALRSMEAQLYDLYNKPQEVWTEADFKLQAKAKIAYKKNEGPDPELIKVVVQAKKEVERAKAQEKTTRNFEVPQTTWFKFDRRKDSADADASDIILEDGKEIGNYGFRTLTDGEPKKANRVNVFLKDRRVEWNEGQLLFVSPWTPEANKGLSYVTVPEKGKTYIFSHGALEARVTVQECRFSEDTGEFVELKISMETYEKAQGNNNTVSFEPKAVTEVVQSPKKPLLLQRKEARDARQASEAAAAQAAESVTPDIDTDTSATTVESKPAVAPSRTRLIDRVQQRMAEDEAWKNVPKWTDDTSQPRPKSLADRLRVQNSVTPTQENLSPQEERVLSQKSYDYIDGVNGSIREKIIVDGKEVGEYGYSRMNDLPGGIVIWLIDKATNKFSQIVMLPQINVTPESTASRKKTIDRLYKDVSNLAGVITRGEGKQAELMAANLKLSFDISNVSHEHFRLNTEVTQKKSEARPTAQSQDNIAASQAGSAEPQTVLSISERAERIKQGYQSFKEQSKEAMKDGVPWLQVAREVGSTFDPRPGVKEALKDGVPWSQVVREVASTFSPKSIKEKVREMKDKLSGNKDIGWLVIDNWREKRLQKSEEELLRRSMDPVEQQRVAQQAQESLQTSNLAEGQRGWINKRLMLDLAVGAGAAALSYQLNQQGIDISLLRNLINIVTPTVGAISVGFEWLHHKYASDAEKKKLEDDIEKSSRFMKFIMKNRDIMYALAVGLGFGAGISGMQDAIERADFSQTAQEMPEPPAIPTETPEPIATVEPVEVVPPIEPTVEAPPEFIPNPNESGLESIDPAANIPLDETVSTPRPEATTVIPEVAATIEPTVTPEPTATVEPVEVIPTVEPTVEAPPEEIITPPAEAPLRDLTQDSTVYSEIPTPPEESSSAGVMPDAIERGVDLPPAVNEVTGEVGTWDSYDAVVSEPVGEKTLWRSISDQLDENSYLNIQRPGGTTDVIKDLIQDMNPDIDFNALNPNTPIQTLSSDAMDKLATMVDASFSAEQPTELQQAFIDSRNDPTGAHHFSEDQIRNILESIGS